MPTICLSMIVRNEAPVIRRCLESVRPILDHWIIVDTGSTDGTQQIVREVMVGLPGFLVERPWIDFAHNRSEALTLARPQADFTLIIDADDELLLPPGFVLPNLAADGYEVDIADEEGIYRRTQFVSNAKPWRYRGILHEVLDCPGAITRALPITMRRNHDGARRRDPDTYRRDAALLERALTEETDPFLTARYTFYLAQSRRDCGDQVGALEAYLQRAKQGLWTEEVYVSLLNAGRLMRSLGHAADVVLRTFSRATALCPHRAEAAYAASRFCRLCGLHKQGCDIAEPVLGVELPASGLFLEPWIYEYGLDDEFAVNAFFAARYADSLKHSLRALAADRLPAPDRGRILANAHLAAQRLTGWQADAPVPPPSRLLATRRAVEMPRVLVSILAKQRAPVLPFFLQRIVALDYPKEQIVLYVRTNNNTDRTRDILRDWLAENGAAYAGVDFDDRDLPTRVEHMAVHDWNPTRLRMIAAIRGVTLAKVAEHQCDFLFVIDVDNFILPSTLRELVALDLPIVAPLVREALTGSRYANYHARIDDAGYYLETPRYDEVLYRRITGVIEVPVVHCTYLVRGDVVPRLTYEDGSGRFEYVIFSDSARRAGIPQYIDNRQVYGHLTLHDDQPAIVACQLERLAEWCAGDGSVDPFGFDKAINSA